MKQNKQTQLNYQKMMVARMKKVEAQILNDSLTNPLLKRAGEIPDYFKYWIDGAKLVAVLPALEHGQAKANPYYSVGAIENGIEQHNIRISPVFMYKNEHFEDLTLDTTEPSKKRFFTFDSEDSMLYSYEKKPHSQDYHFVKKSSFEEYKEHIIAHPIVLFFYGCDDGNVGKRFKTEAQAFEYLNLIDVFEDIFDDDLQYHN